MSVLVAVGLAVLAAAWVAEVVDRRHAAARPVVARRSIAPASSAAVNRAA